MNSCIEKSVAYSVNNPLLTGSVAAIPVPTEVADPNIYKIVTVINDTDQDVKVTFQNTNLVNGEFIVPKSIKAFTKVLRVGTFVGNSIKVTAITANATGKVTFNFSS